MTTIPSTIANANMERPFYRQVSATHSEQYTRVHVYVDDEALRKQPGFEGFDGQEAPMVHAPIPGRSPSGGYDYTKVAWEDVDAYKTTSDPTTGWPVKSYYAGKTAEGWDHHVIELPVDATNVWNHGVAVMLNTNVGPVWLDTNIFFPKG
jgi:hypothetical protein